MDGHEHPIYFVSRTLTSAKHNYTTTEKECLAVLLSIERSKGYLQGETFTVITDHHSLLWLNNLKDPQGKGALHKIPDALSRAFAEPPKITALQKKTEIEPWY